MTNPELQALYHEFNKKWFGNKLPKDMVVCFAGLHMHRMAVTRYYRARPLYIEMNKNLRWNHSVVAMTLLHEMVHVALPYRINHGPEFHKAMKSLAKRGAFTPFWRGGFMESGWLDFWLFLIFLCVSDISGKLGDIRDSLNKKDKQ